MRADARRRLAEWLGRLALMAFSCAIALAAAEVGARWLESRRVEQQREMRRSEPGERFHPVLGWEKVPGATVHVSRGELDVTFRYNSHGLRGPDRDYAAPEGVRRVLLLGDSFAEGYYVDEKDSARAVLERLLEREAGCGPWEVVNGATAGYSTDQEYLFYREEGHRYGAELVVLLLYYNDLAHNTRPTIPGGMRKPLFALQDGVLALQNVPLAAPPRPRSQQEPAAPGREERLPPWRGSVALRMLGRRTVDSAPRLHRWLERVGLVPPAFGKMPEELTPFGVGAHVPEMWSMAEALLRALRDEVQGHGARLVVLYVPVVFEVDEEAWELTRSRYEWGHKWHKDKVARRLGAICDHEGIDFVDPTAALEGAVRSGQRPYFTTDFHWNEVGNEIAARSLVPIVQARCR